MEQIRIITEVNSIVICMIAFLLLLLKQQIHQKAENIMKNALIIVMVILLADIGDAACGGSSTALARLIVPLSNFTMYFFQQLLIIFMGSYLKEVIHEYDSEVNDSWINVIFLLQGFGMIACIATVFTGWFYYIDSNNIYQRGPLFLYFLMLAMMGLLVELGKVIQYRKILKIEEMVAVLCYIMIPMIGLLLQIRKRGFSFFNLAMTVAVLIVIGIYEYQYYKIEKEKDQVLAQSRAYLLNSQIKPHFLFNSLNVIASLIEYEPETAKKAIGHLSKYLRKNLDLQASEKPVSIWEELDFTQNYLYMEKLRFGDKINIRYEVDEEVHFDVPLLSIQTIVENAIRHGIRKKMEGGTVLIRIYETDDVYKIQIIDDGVGFDPNNQEPKEKKADSNGVGMQNVKERLKLLCHGTLQVESEPGKGTRATIIIPKG